MTLCPQCLAVKVVAIEGGPTCTHQLNHGPLWWPSNFERISESERLAWLEKKKNT